MLDLMNELFALIIHQSEHHCPKELAFWKFPFLAMRIWKILEHFRTSLGNDVVAVLDRELWPAWLFLSATVFEKQNFISL